MTFRPAIPPFLDPGYLPAVVWNRAYRKRCELEEGVQPLAIALERPDGSISRYDTNVLAHIPRNYAFNRKYVERLVKFLLWARGGYRVIIGGNEEIARMIAQIYSPTGERKFDEEFMGERIYRRPFVVESRHLSEVPEAKETVHALGRNLDGCRIGFDLGGSDRKCAAVIDGKCVFSEEVRWDPYFQSDPAYHYAGINDSLKRAAAHLPRVDCIGGSSAGVYVNNEVRVASLFRGVSPADFDARVRRIFFDLQKEWGGVPFEVSNDGEVTALAGSMCLGENSVLGISMGTSVAAGCVTAEGAITSWLNELAFAPIDYRDDAPIDEWSGERGAAVQYFCQQGVARLAVKAGFDFPQEMQHADRLKAIQAQMEYGDFRAARIYQTIGTCFGYAIAHYADFYDLKNLLILGRVTSGEGGELMLREAGYVLRAELPEIADQIKLRTPNEQTKRLGQAVAAASLPKLRN